MIAPAVTATSQGSSGADASDFQGLLAAALSTDGGALASGAAVSPSTGFQDTTETESADRAAEGFLVSGLLATPVPAPVATPPAAPLVPAEATEAAPPADSSNSTSPPAEDPAYAGTSGPRVLPGEPPVKGPAPLVLPDAGPGDVADLIVAAAGGAGDLMEGAPSGEQSSLADPASASVPGQTTPPPASAAPPLRPLAERASKALDRTDPRSPDSAETTDAKTRKPAAAAAAQASDAQTKPTPPGAAAVATSPAADRAVANGSPPPFETTAPATETAAPVREHQPSTLSRASLDATVQIAAQIARKLEGRSTRFEIALRPDELGRVDVKLDIDSEGRLAARLAFDNPAAATDLRGRVDELRRHLEAAGFQLADDAFEFAERDSGSSAFDRGQDARQGQNRAFKAAARLNAEIDVAQPPRWLALSLSPSGVDMKV